MALRHAEPGEVISLKPTGAEFQADANSTAIVKSDAFEAIRLVITAGGEMPSHAVAGHITLQCIQGHVRLVLADREVDLRPEDWVYLEGGEPHAVRGIENSSLLLTILLDGRNV